MENVKNANGTRDEHKYKRMQHRSLKREREREREPNRRERQITTVSGMFKLFVCFFS